MACNVQLQYGRGQVAKWSGTLASLSSPPTTDVHTGPGDYATLPANGTPTWAVAVIIVGSLAVLASGALIALLVRRRHQKA
ncbi:MAG TPA: transmembrane domain-containing protein [Acidimicrobiales bacterium]|nr:transmembrane domain-containing protein [Acidimicrobiales bacterium]